MELPNNLAFPELPVNPSALPPDLPPSVQSTSSESISRRLLERIFNAPPKASSMPSGDYHKAFHALEPQSHPELERRVADYSPDYSPDGRLGTEVHSHPSLQDSPQVIPHPVLNAIERRGSGHHSSEALDQSLRGAVLSLQSQTLEAYQARLNKSEMEVGDAAKLRKSSNNHRAVSYASGERGRSPEGSNLRRDGRNLAGGSSKRGLDVRSIRADFPALHQEIHGHPLVWFDNGATTHKPFSVIEAMSQFYACDYSNIHRAAHSLAARATDHYENARETVREFIHADSSQDIVFVRGTTEGINFIAHTCKSFLGEGDEILLTEMEHHANIVPWQMVADEKRAKIRVIPFDDRGEILMEEYKRLLSPRTKIVSVTHASNTLGTILPVEEMGVMAHRRGARFIVDGAQSIAHLPVDVQKIGCDFFVFSGHKVFAPTGIGAVYVHPELQDLLPPWQGGGNMIHRVSFDGTTFSDPPAKFEAGTPSIGDAVGLGAALRYLQQFDPISLLQHEHALTEHATKALEGIPGVRTIGHAKGKVGVVSFVLDGFTTEQVGKELDRFGIAVRTGHHCAQPSLRHFGLESTVRPSFALYNTHEEIDRMVAVIHKLARRVR